MAEYARRAWATVRFGGLDVSEEIGRSLISLSYTDNEEDEADDLQLKLEDRDGVWKDSLIAGAVRSDTKAVGGVVKGMPVEASLRLFDGAVRKLDMGRFEIDSMTSAGPPAIVTIKGTSLFFRSAVRQVKKTQAWEAYHLSGIGAEIARRGGYRFFYDSAVDPYYDRVEQSKVSDVSFLVQLAHDAGLSLKFYNETLILFDQALYETREPVRVFRAGRETYDKWSLTTGEADTKYDSCRIYYYDPGAGVIEGWAYADDYDGDAKEHTVLELCRRVSGAAEARSLAASQLRLKNKYEYTAKLTTPGDPLLVAGATVQLERFGTFDGRYIISQSKHTLSRSGYTTSVELRRAVKGERTG